MTFSFPEDAATFAVYRMNQISRAHRTLLTNRVLSFSGSSVNRTAATAMITIPGIAYMMHFAGFSSMRCPLYFVIMTIIAMKSTRVMAVNNISFTKVRTEVMVFTNMHADDREKESRPEGRVKGFHDRNLT